MSTCKARQYSDQMQCECGLTWDMNDSDPPKCRAEPVQLYADPEVRALARALPTTTRPSGFDGVSISDYEEVLADHRRLVRELDVLLNGEQGRARQAALCDIVSQLRAAKLETVTISVACARRAYGYAMFYAEQNVSGPQQRKHAKADAQELERTLLAR